MIKYELCDDLGGFTGKDIVDIDADHGIPHMCSIYAEDIYANLRSAEVSLTDIICKY